jgi:hypothetical protein
MYGSNLKHTISHTITAYDTVCHDLRCRRFDRHRSLGHGRSMTYDVVRHIGIIRRLARIQMVGFSLMFYGFCFVTAMLASSSLTPLMLLESLSDWTRSRGSQTSCRTGAGWVRAASGPHEPLLGAVWALHF